MSRQFSAGARKRFEVVVQSFRPKILIPYHTGETNRDELRKLLKEEKGVELRIRDMK